MKLSVNFQECDESIGFDFEEKTESFNIGFGDNSNGSSIDNEKVNAIEKKVDILETQVLEVNESVKTAITKAENAEKTANESKFTTDDTLTLKDGILSVNTNVVGGGGGGVTSWDDLRDKPFYEETEIAELVSNLTTEAYDNGQFPPCNFIVGEKYNVIWNGESYNDLICYESDGYRVIGGEGYPFYIDDDGGNSLYIESTTDETDFVVTIIGKRVTIKTIDEKFLPAWDDLKNKPFSETPPLFDITWDGDMEGHEVVDDRVGGYAVKVSDEVFTKKQLLNSTTFYSNSYEVINTEENISVDEEFGAIYLDGVIVIFSAENFNSAVGLPEGTFSNGVWFNNWTGEEPYYINRLVAATTIKTIDEKYIPDSIARVEDIDKEISWNDITDKPFGEELGWARQESLTFKQVTTNGNITKGIWQNVSVNLVEGQRYKIVVIDSMNNKVLYEWDNVAIRDTSGTGSTAVSGESSDVYLSYNIIFKMTNLSYVGEKPSSALVSVVIYNESPAIKPLEEKYIPDTIARVSDIPSTEDFATKQYVDEAIENIDIPEGGGDLTRYATKEYVDNAVANKEVSWNDITDKPFYDNSYDIEVANINSNTVSFTFSTNTIAFETGKHYRFEVRYDLKVGNYFKHQATAVATSSTSVSFSSLGWSLNLTLHGTGMVYSLITGADISNDDIVSANCKIFKFSTELVFLNEKFLPEVVVLESELEAKGYQTEEQVTELINNALGVIENGTY